MSNVETINIKKRACGLRKPGHLYLVGGGKVEDSDFFPRAITCPHCGLGLKASRNISKFYPAQLWPELLRPELEVFDVQKPFHYFYRDEMAYAVTIGVQHYPTPESYLAEAAEQGISRLIQAVPRDFVAGETWVFLIHPHVFPGQKWSPGAIAAFRPRRIEYVVRGDESQEYLDSLISRGVQPVKPEYS